MRQVDRDELIWMIFLALRRVPASAWRDAVDTRPEVQRRGRVAIATIVADALARLEVLSSAPAAMTPFGVTVDQLRGEDPGPLRLIE